MDNIVKGPGGTCYFGTGVLPEITSLTRAEINVEAGERAVEVTGKTHFYRITVSDADDNTTSLITSYTTFAEVNDSEDDAEMRAEVAALDYGESVTYGGGAMPIIVITRVRK